MISSEMYVIHWFTPGSPCLSSAMSCTALVPTDTSVGI